MLITDEIKIRLKKKYKSIDNIDYVLNQTTCAPTPYIHFKDGSILYVGETTWFYLENKIDNDIYNYLMNLRINKINKIKQRYNG